MECRSGEEEGSEGSIGREGREGRKGKGSKGGKRISEEISNAQPVSRINEISFLIGAQDPRFVLRIAPSLRIIMRHFCSSRSCGTATSRCPGPLPLACAPTANLTARTWFTLVCSIRRPCSHLVYFGAQHSLPGSAPPFFVLHADHTAYLFWV